MSRYGVQGRVTAHPGQGDELEAVLLEAAEALGDVPDCELYVVSRSPDDPDSVWVTEVWASQAAHQDSLGLDSVKALIQRGRPLIAGIHERFEVTPIGGKGLD